MMELALALRARIRRARMGLPAASPGIRPAAPLARAAVPICPHCKAWIVAARGGIACLSSRYSSSQRCSPPALAAAGSSMSFPRGRTPRRGRHRNSRQARPVRMTAARATPSRSRRSPLPPKVIPKSEARAPTRTAGATGGRLRRAAAAGTSYFRPQVGPGSPPEGHATCCIGGVQ